MPRGGLGNSSFINLFPTFVYDKSQVPENSLDIWNAYRIKILNKNQNDTAFFFHQLNESDTFVSLAYEYYKEPKLWWLVALVNEVEDPFVFIDQVLQEDQPIIKILKPIYIGGILMEITNSREYAQSLYNKNKEDF